MSALRGLTCFGSGFWHILWVSVSECVPRVSAISHNRSPRHSGREHERPLVVVFETVSFRHAVIHVKVRGQRNLLRWRRLLHSAPREPLLTLARRRGAPLGVGAWLGACIWEGSEARNVGLPVGTDVRLGRKARARREGFLKHPGAKDGVACFTLVRGYQLGGSDVRWAHGPELTLVVRLEGFCSHVAGRVVGQCYVRTLWLRGGSGLAVPVFPVFRLRESQIVGAVPLRAAGFCDVPQRCTFLSVPSIVWQLLLLTLHVIWTSGVPLWRHCLSGGTRCVLWLPSTTQRFGNEWLLNITYFIKSLYSHSDWKNAILKSRSLPQTWTAL